MAIAAERLASSRMEAHPLACRRSVPLIYWPWLLFSLLAADLWADAATAADTVQRPARIGYVHSRSEGQASHLSGQVFWDRLRTLGWTEGKNLQVERRYAAGRMEAFPRLMDEVVQKKVDVIVTLSTPGALAAQKATHTIPIVVAMMGDPVGTGLASSLAHPGGNITGVSVLLAEGIPGKWLELLQEVMPNLSTVAVLSNPRNPLWRISEDQLATAARAKKLKTVILDASTPGEIDRAMEQARQQAQAIVVFPDATFIEHHERIVATAARLKLPAVYAWADFVIAGGLLSYGPDPREAWARAAIYVDRILRGTKPGDLPIAQPAQFSLLVNVTTAKALGLVLPESILLRADEVIR